MSGSGRWEIRPKIWWGGKLTSEKGVNSEVGLKDMAKWDFEVEGSS